MGRTWVVIPMYNEGTVVEEVVRDVCRVFPHVVCVDDGSRDESVDAARAGGAIVVQHSINLGQGAALQTGFDFALSDPLMTEVVTFDADGQHQVADAVGMAGFTARKAAASNSPSTAGSAHRSHRRRMALRR